VAIALNHLGRHGCGLQSQRAAGVRLDARREVREGPHSSRQLADRNDLTGSFDSFDVPRQFGVPERQLEPERHRLGVNAVRAPDHGRPPVLFSPRPNGLPQSLQEPEDHVAGLAHLQRLRCIDNVR
jgi:hypothetical protein